MSTERTQIDPGKVTKKRVISPEIDKLHRSRDPHRYDSRVRMKVDVIPMSKTLAGCIVEQGEHLVDVPESLVPTVIQEVETAEGLQAYESAKQRFAEREAAFRAEHGPDAKIPDSPEAIFVQIMGRDMRALRSADVVKENGEPVKTPPPLSDEDRRLTGMVDRVMHDNKQSGQGGKRRHH